ncbi:CASP8 and FADD-like apoptosis regulator a isoform X4 [Ictalurus punctatus]|uniref:CASP8 and FADD-like apoptosis regulator a isoform X4 n=1 Tax=Ictalurus punctatus TaxID=7998 RepID=A0A2D0Q797_ICTPU|nr:CASP8 and FADD-like apoptosis regulator a isoform X4 [Ictalurus punctatus]XP_017314569.1 CASP8 and FADD-like apoptosis regulator a isoform X4 [Ictalurus punctatus]
MTLHISHSVMAGEYCSMVNRVIGVLTIDECKKLMFLTTDLLSGQRVEDTRSALVAMVTCRGQSRPADVIMMEILFHLKRFDILKQILGKTREQVEEELRRGGIISNYRVLMMDLSENMERNELESIIFMLHNKITKNQAKQITSFLDVVCVLEQTGEVSSVKLELIEECVRNIRRNDLIKKIQSYRVCETVKLSVCETGVQHSQVSVDEYNMNYDLRGVCVIIDSTGNGGALLTHTFRQLGFHVFPYTQTEVCEVCEVNLIMKTINQNSILQRAAVFTCFMLNTHTHASHTPPLNTHIKLMEACVECEMLKKKPKLFFNHTIRSDQNLQTDALPCTTHTPHTHPLHNAEDVLWSVCETGVEVLDGNEHNSVYLQSISSALLQGHTRRLHVLDALIEVNREILEHNLRNPDNRHHLTFTHTLRKRLYL